jgi:hypothetical protein
MTPNLSADDLDFEIVLGTNAFKVSTYLFAAASSRL